MYYTSYCSKMVRWSRVKTPPFHGGNTGSNPVRTISSAIAQLVERMTVNHDVTGSSPVGGVDKA